MKPKYLHATRIPVMLLGLPCLTTYYLVDMLLLAQDIVHVIPAISLNLLNTTCHSGWKSLFFQLKCTFLFLVLTNTPYIGLGDTPPSVFTWLREVLNEGEKSISCIWRKTLHPLQLLHELWRKGRVWCEPEGIWNTQKDDTETAKESKQWNKNTKTTRVTKALILVNTSFFISTL